ncbi:MAG TPA: SPW repeat protein [Bryobacteraceae bacterium]|nr:SPW repeat protein [Bryobacteraceae bacterium]
MTPNQTTQHASSAAITGTINLLAGIWLFVSPWVYGAYTNQDAWNSWIIGAVIAIFAAIRLTNPGGLRIFSWINMALGVYVFFSPWIYGYVGNTGRFVNSLCVGVLVFVMGISGFFAVARPSAPYANRT